MALTSTGMTLADLLERFGAIPAARIRYDPTPGTATEQDVIALEARENRLFELVDGVLVEKAMGFYESFLAMRLVQFLLTPGLRYRLMARAQAEDFEERKESVDAFFASFRFLPEGKKSQ